jgi:Ca-activated chloride channel family protein
MRTRRYHLMAAGALLLATALAGAAMSGTGNLPLSAAGHGKSTFAAAAGGPVSFRGNLDRTAVLLGRDGLVRLELILASKWEEARRSVRRPTDLVIVLDRSGSMTGEKIEHARAAVRELLSQLGPQDRFALVTYSDEAGITIPLASADDRVRPAWIAAIGEVEPSGGTNMSSGLDAGLDLIGRSRGTGRVPHVILISDGLANQGDASHEGLTRRARRAAGGEYMLSTVGVGADFNEYLMTALADAGTGNYYYLRNALGLSEIFARELDTARTTVASGVAVEIEPGPGVRVVDAAGYPLETKGSTVIFRPGSLFAGQERRVWVTLAVPQHAAGEYDLGRFSLSYGQGAERTTLTLNDVPRVACVKSEDQFFGSVDVDAWSRSVVVDAYNKMQEEVARAVKEGRRDEALERVRKFKDDAAAMNSRLQSAPVAQQLHSADRLEAEVGAAFVGPNQAERQNELSKAKSLRGIDGRRAGNKK